MLDSSTYLLETARSLVLNPKDPPTWSVLAGHSRTVSDSIKSLITSIRFALTLPMATSVSAGFSWIKVYKYFLKSKISNSLPLRNSFLCVLTWNINLIKIIEKCISIFFKYISGDRDKAPGQRECDYSIDNINKCIRDIEQASLAAVGQTLPCRDDISMEVSSSTPSALSCLRERT